VPREPISPELALIDPELAHPPDELETVMIDSPNVQQTDERPSLETLMFKAGLIDADQLGELVRDAVVAQRPVAALAIERSLVTPKAIETLLAQAGEAAEQPAPEPASMPTPEPEPVLLAPAELAPTIPFVPQPVPVVAAAAAVVEPEPEPQLEPEPHIALAPDAEAAAVPADPIPLHAVAPAVHALPAQPVDVVPVEPLEALQPAPAAAAFEVLVLLTTGETVRAGAADSRDAAEQVARATARRFADATEWPLVGGRFVRPGVVVSVDIVRRLED
jgi:hypothetical protein